RLDRDTIEHVGKLVAMHQRANAYEDDWTDGAVRRFIREAGEILEDLLDLSAADVTSKRQERRNPADARGSALRAPSEQRRAAEEVDRLASRVDGRELLALLGRRPGPWIKPVKDRLLAAVLDGELAPDDKDGATRLAQTLMTEEPAPTP